MTASSTGDMRQPSSDKDIVAPSPKRPPILTASSSYSRPPPQPLDLPKPRSPPPKTETPHPNKPPEPIPPLTPAPVAQEEEEVPRGKQRWWTDWLCGCMESGDHQVGISVRSAARRSSSKTELFVLPGCSDKSVRVKNHGFLHGIHMSFYSISRRYWHTWTILLLVCITPLTPIVFAVDLLFLIFLSNTFSDSC